MGAVNMVACTALDACSGVPVTSTLCKQFGGVDPQAALVNAQSQVTTLARMGELGAALGTSASKLQSLWQLGAAGTGAAGAIGQIQGCFGDLVGHGTDLAKQIQAAGKLLQSALRIIEFVKAANKAVAALMATPWSMPAAKALATATAAQTISWIGMITQMAMSIGQVLSAVQQATHSTDATTAALGNVLEGGAGAVPVTGTPPTFPTQQPTAQAYPAYPSYPTVTTSPPTPSVAPAQAPGQPTPAYSQQTGLPTVHGSGWIPQGATQGTTASGQPGGGSGLTIDITDSDHDGKYEVRVNVPESQLNRDMKINVDAKVGDQEVKANIDIDV